MKKPKIKYEDFITIPNIEFIYKRIKSNIKNKRSILVFEENYTSNICNIYNILINKKYQPGKYNIFSIREPKKRLIMSQNIGDKIINNFVAYFFLQPILENSFINSNVATRKNKGTSYGIKLLRKYLNEIKSNEFYILKCDISKYFYNINHSILKDMLLRKIFDKDILKILFDIIDSTDEEYIYIIIEKYCDQDLVYRKGYGLPIGNMTSQILAIFYLSELDHIIKEKFKIKYYIRYMDDFVIINNSKNNLVELRKYIDDYLTKIDLKLNNKTMITNGKYGISFLGYNFRINNNKLYQYITNRNKRKISKKIRRYNKGIYSYESLISYNGYIDKCNSYSLMKQLHIIYKRKNG